MSDPVVSEFVYLRVPKPDPHCSTEVVLYRNQVLGTDTIEVTHTDEWRGQEMDITDAVQELVEAAEHARQFILRLTITGGDDCIAIEKLHNALAKLREGGA